jgi:uncharacterized protein
MVIPLPVLDPPSGRSSASVVDPDVALAREQALETWLRARGRVLIGYSGGVDSAYLAVMARRTLGRDAVLAVLGRSASVPAEQWAVAQAVADAHDVPVLVVATDELDDPDYAANPSDRCYHCKKVLWRHLAPLAASRGFATVLDGTNADDRLDHRPGERAARERRVESPLAELGFTKAEIRQRSQVLGLKTWDRPSAPCLASRLPYGTAVTADRLQQVERAEAGLRALGMRGDLRVRHHLELARVELTPPMLAEWGASTAWPRLVAAVRAAGFARVALDLDGFRSGSLNVLGGVQTAPAPTMQTPDASDDAATSWAASCPAPEVHGRLRVWELDAASRDRALREPPLRRALVARARADGATHAALALPSA